MLREESAKSIANQIFLDEMSRLGASGDAFMPTGVTRNWLSWIVTWESIHISGSQVGVSLGPFDVDVWGKPFLPDCVTYRSKVVVSFGEVCVAR